MRLYGFWRSTATWRVRIALAHKGIDYEYVPVHLRNGGGEQHAPEFHAKNPMHHVPVLELEGVSEAGVAASGAKPPSDGPRYVAESMAILELLEERFPTPALLPVDAFMRARARQLAFLVVSGIQPLQNTAVQLWLAQESNVDVPAWTRHWVMRGLSALEELTRETAGRYSVGDELSFADVCLVPQLAFARRFAVELDGYPTLTAIDARCAELPAFMRAHANAQPDAESS